MAIDQKAVAHVVRLAHLELSEEDLARYGTQLGAILDYIAQLEKLDVRDVEPLAHAAESAGVFREDVPRPCLPREEALKNAPERTGDFFVVPRVIE